MNASTLCNSYPCALSAQMLTHPAQHERLPAFRKHSSTSLDVQRFRGGLVFKAHGLLYHSTLGLRVIKKKKKNQQSVLRRHSLGGGACMAAALVVLNFSHSLCYVHHARPFHPARDRYRGTSLIRKRFPIRATIGPYGYGYCGVLGGRRLLMSEVPV